MACEAITNALATESSRLGPWFYHRKMFGQSPWASLVKRQQYPDGIGYDFRLFTAERAAPSSVLSWTDANAFSAGEDCGACANTFNSVDMGYTTYTTTLRKYELKSRMICVEDLMRAWETRQQIMSVREELGNYVRLAWDQRDRIDTFTHCKYKVVANGSLQGNMTDTVAAAYPAECATDVLQQVSLDYYYYLLIRDGAHEGALGRNGAAPILPLIIGPEASRALLVQGDADRQDIRWSSDSDELLKTLAVNRIYRNFAHVVDVFPRRFTCAGGTYTEVSPWSSVAATVGNKAEVATAYRNAPYEEAIIFNREIWHQLVPRPWASGGSDTNFDPVSYTGEWVWKNIADQDGTNVFNTQGRWYGRMFAAAQRVKPELGVSIVFRRCNPELAAIPSPCNYS